MLIQSPDAETADRWHFHPITNSRAHEEVIEQITFAILSGAYHPGERLPNIEALARLMGVSKPVVGEALKVLAGASVVRALRGVRGGVVVETNQVPERVMAIASPLRHFELAEILEARRPIELQIALMAAQRAKLGRLRRNGRNDQPTSVSPQKQLGASHPLRPSVSLYDGSNCSQ